MTHVILKLAKYCMTELNFSYFLPGKIQTDPLEEMFGKYRMLAGSQCFVYKLLKKLKCNVCHSGLVSDKYFDSSHSFIKELDHGGLQYPHLDVVSTVMYTYAKTYLKTTRTRIFKHRKSQASSYHDHHCAAQRKLSHLDVCDVGHTLETIIQHIVSMSSNALLRNYCLKKNETCKKNPKNQKISTLIKNVDLLKFLPQ
ncbi:hypothetical protein PR048_001485 [Dryococelus australis]|uniref:Uncharacterized protein n=1 Tax=Dryococelus australis TaxID=614101 RepID=A0ABQ9IHK5_9NEOP|nr:hypothetical protein PR048_001485 [Dryococelus australis]